MNEKLYLIIPVYNEEEVINKTFDIFSSKLNYLINYKSINKDSKILYIDDGSNDKTWEIICNLFKANSFVTGVRLSCNRGHQNALLAGLNESLGQCDICVSIDCDGQDDINAIDKMIVEYRKGSDIVYGVRNDRTKDSFFKRFTAEMFYKLLYFLGAKIIYNHADYRLLSNIALKALLSYDESNIYIRGIVPMLGFKSSIVEYKRELRVAGKTHYSIKKMFSLATNGITNLSIKPLRIITAIGFFIALISVFCIVWAVFRKITNNTVWGLSSLVAVICFLSGVQLLSLGIIGEYIGKIYIETKHRPKYIISERTE